MIFNPCSVVPIYNHKDTIRSVINSLLDAGLYCIIVDDCSNKETKIVLENIADKHSDVCLITLEKNQGKGKAVLKGFEKALEHGFSHCFQVDADGQHNLSDIPRFLKYSRSNPDALICGQAIFDKTIPKGRLIARYITHFWVCVETLSLKLLDSMCGFRIYPMKSAIELIRRKKIGSRMDFDTEILVRLIWANVRVITLGTKVTYPKNGLSHFRYFRDNLLISKMHTKLVLEMLWRLPTTLIRKKKR